MAGDPQAAAPTTPSAPSAPDAGFTPLSIPDFAKKIRSYNPTQLTPEVVDDATLVRKTLERKPELMKYVQTSEPRSKLRRGREPQAAAADQIQSIFKQHNVEFKPENLDKLPWKDRFQVMSIVAKMFAQEQAGEWKEAKGWREKLHALIGTAGGVSVDVMGRMASGIADPKTAAIGATGIVDPALPAAYFFIEGGSRLPGEARKLAQDPSYENIVSTGLTATQVVGSAAAGVEGAGTGVGGKVIDKVSKGAEGGKGFLQRVKESGGNPEIAEKVVSDARKARDAYDAQVIKINEQYKHKVAEREAALAKAEVEYVEKVAAAREEWVKQAAAGEHEHKGAGMIEAHRQKLESVTKVLTKIVDENVKNTEKLVRSDLDGQFNAVREQMKIEDKTDEHPAVYPDLNADAIRNRIREARQMLQGAPEDIKAFNDLVKQMAKDKGEGAEEGSGGRVDVSDPGTEFKINWDEGRTQSSALGRASASESISGNVRRAIRHVLGDVTAKVVDGKMEKTYTGLEGELQRVADERGAGKAYTKARMGWRQYMEDWNDMSSEKGGGSPLARLLRAADAGVTLAELKGKYGDRLIETLARYTKFGAAPENLSKLRNYDMELSSLPDAKHVPKPEPMKMPEREPAPADIPTPAEEAEAQKATGQLKEPPTTEQMMTQLKEAKTLHARDVGRSGLKIKMHDITMGALTMAHALGAYNSLYALGYTVARVGYAMAVNLKATQDWLARVTPQDIKAINEAYAADPAGKAELQHAVTEGLIKGAGEGTKPSLKNFAGFLTPAQMGRVLRAYAPYGQPQKVPPQPVTPDKEGGTREPPISQNLPRGDLQPPSIWADLRELLNSRSSSTAAPGA